MKNFEALGAWSLQKFGRDPFGIQLQVARSILALGTFVTLAFNPASILFHSGEIQGPQPANCTGVTGLGAFCIFPGQELEITRITIALLCLPALLGVAPAISTWLHAYAAFSLSSNSIGIEGGDQLTVNLAILLAFASSFDYRFFGFQEQRLARQRPRFITPNLIVWVCIFQVAYVYVEAALVKLNHPIWSEGSALWYWVQNSGFGVSAAQEEYLLDFLASPSISAIATWGTMVLELALAGVLILGTNNRSLRLWGLVAGVSFHLLIAVLMGLVTFFFAMTGALTLTLWRPRDGYPLSLFKILRRKPALELNNRFVI